ncbi:MAG: hypothetical protein GEV11_11435 [Streptosporangiales bacterium]|nr:hypothetical protein [Streptosporangiales bacterium]
MPTPPVPDADTRPFWEGVAEGELRLQRCDDCRQAIFYPRSICPHCQGSSVSWFTAAGTGTVHTYTVAHRAFGDAAKEVPFAVALVDLDEGARMMSRITGDPAAVSIGARVRMAPETFEGADGAFALPYFRIDGGGA